MKVCLKCCCGLVVKFDQVGKVFSTFCKNFFTFCNKRHTFGAKYCLMSKRLLLPHKFKKVGWFILMAAIIAGIWRSFSDYEVNWLQWKVFSFYSKEIFQDSAAFSWRPVNVTNTLIGVLFIIGSVLVGFSKEKEEDEFIRELRLSSLLWAVLISYALLLLAFLTIYGFAFFSVMVYNMFTVLVIFIIRFHYLLYKNAKGLPNEK